MKKKRDDKLIVKVRTIFPSGKSLVITLPKRFVEKHGLTAGDKVAIITNGIMKVIPTKEVS
jgi:antitoxin component of MazEF toxin-antitoxin module